MKRWLANSSRLLLQVAIFLIFIAAGVLVSGIFQSSSVAPLAPTLTVLPADLNLGTVWQQPELKFSIPVRNRSSKPLSVTEISTTCNCTRIEPRQFTVDAGDTITLTGAIDLSRSIHRPEALEEAFAVGLRAQVKMADKLPAETLEWPLHGTVKKALLIEPAVLSLYGAYEVISGHDAPTIDVFLTPRQEITEIVPEWNGQEGEVACGAVGDGTWLLQYTPSLYLPRGEVRSRINLRTRLENGQHGPDIEIPIEGQVVAPVRLSPERVTLIPGENGAPATATVNIISYDGSDWTLVDWKSEPPGVLVNTPDVIPIQTASVRFSLAVKAPILDKRNIIIHMLLTNERGQNENCVLVVIHNPTAQ